MRRYLVVANQTLGGEHLMEILRERCAAGPGPCAFHVVVPAGADPGRWSSDEEQELAGARRRLDDALVRFRSLAADVDGEIGDARAVDAVLDAFRRQTYDGVIVSTLPAGVSRWLKMDLVSRLERAVDVPVTHVIGAYEPVGA